MMGEYADYEIERYIGDEGPWHYPILGRSPRRSPSETNALRERELNANTAKLARGLEKIAEIEAIKNKKETKTMSATYPTLAQANAARQKEWDTDDQITLAYRGNELAGEAGEACNVIKKLERERMGIKGSRDTVEHLAEELADVVICASLIAMDKGIDLDQAVEDKFNATSAKVGLATRYKRNK